MQPNKTTSRVDLPSPPLLAPGTMVLFALNVSVFTLMVASGGCGLLWSSEHSLAWGANYAPVTMDGQWWRVLSCMFVHAGILHIAFNLWILWQVGRTLEFTMGSLSYLVLYFACGLCASLAGLIFHPFAVLQGASGALFGLVGALVALLFLNRKRLHLQGLRRLRNHLITFLGLNLILGMMVEQIDLLGHTVGLGVGFALGLLMMQSSADGHRWAKCRRAAVATGVAVVWLACLTFLMPPAPPDFYRELTRFTALERDCLRRYNRAQKQVNEGVTRQRVFLEFVDGQLLPQWRSAGEKVLAIDKYPRRLASMKPKMDAYIQTRQNSWELLVDSLRHDNQRKLARHREQWSAAEQLARELSAER